MTQNEAIEILERMKSRVKNDSFWLALDFAIKELEERPPRKCNNCDYRRFTERFIEGIVEVMNKTGITSVEQLTEILKGAEK